MRAIQIEHPGALRAVELPKPEPVGNQLLVRVHACGVCRTDLHLLDGEVEIPRPPIVPGHQIVGTYAEWTIADERYCFALPEDYYDILWGERTVRSVANLTRQDATEFLTLAPRVPVRTDVHPYALADTGSALEDLRAGRFQGAAVIEIDR